MTNWEYCNELNGKSFSKAPATQGRCPAPCGQRAFGGCTKKKKLVDVAPAGSSSSRPYSEAERVSTEVPETLAGQLSSLPAGLSLPWEAANVCRKSGFILDFALYIADSTDYISMNTASSALSYRINQKLLEAFQPGAQFIALDPASYPAFFPDGDLEFDDQSIFSTPPEQENAAKTVQKHNWLGYMGASAQLYLAIAPKDPRCLDGVLGEALAGLLDRQEQFIVKHMHSSAGARQTMESASALLLAEAEKRHAEWMSLVVLQPKPLAKYLLDKYGDHASDGLAIAIQRLAASLIQPVGLAFMLSGGRLMLSVFAHSKSDPQLIASQLIKNFRKLYAYDPGGGQLDPESDQARTIQSWRSELPLPELGAYCAAESDAVALTDCLAELF